jgi:hypothetical protein
MAQHASLRGYGVLCTTTHRYMLHSNTHHVQPQIIVAGGLQCTTGVGRDPTASARVHAE